MDTYEVSQAKGRKRGPAGWCVSIRKLSAERVSLIVPKSDSACVRLPMNAAGLGIGGSA